MNEHMTDLYNEEAYANEHLLPLVKQLYDLCAERKIPLICTIAHTNDEERVGISNTTVLPGAERTPVQLAACRLILDKPELAFDLLLREGVVARVEPEGEMH